MITALVLALVVPVNPQISVGVGVEVQVPTVQFEVEPPLVVVSPGVMVVPNYEQEVFFVDGWYWMHSSRGWYRTHNHRGNWVAVSGFRVPRAIYRSPHGKYRHFRGGRRYIRRSAGRGNGPGVRYYDRGRGPRTYDRRDHRGGGRVRDSGRGGRGGRDRRHRR